MMLKYLLVFLGVVLSYFPLKAQSNDWILFTSDIDGNREIYLMSPDGSDTRRLTNDVAEDIEPTWSPNRDRIAFASKRDGDFAIYIMNVDGSGVQRISGANMGNYNSSPNWSPDGSRIVFVSNTNGNPQIYSMNIDGSNLQHLTQDSSESVDPFWSPDARTIVYASNRSGNFEIYVMNADGSNAHALTNDSTLGSDSPAWSPDGTQIAFASNGGSGEIYIMDSSGANVRLLTSSSDYYASSPVWSQDGSQIAYVLWKDKEKRSIRRINSEGSGVLQLSSADYEANWPAWSAPLAISAPQSPTNGFACPPSLPPHLIIGQNARVAPGDPNRLRSSPGKNSDVLALIPAGDRVQVIDGPVCADNYTWWKVNYGGTEGWTVESHSTSYWLETENSSGGSSNNGSSNTIPSGNSSYPHQCAQSLETRLAVNTRIIALQQVRLRDTPTSSVGLALGKGTDMLTIGSPVCAHTDNDPGKAELLWWPVRIMEGSRNGQEGWISESSTSGYNVGIDPTP